MLCRSLQPDRIDCTTTNSTVPGEAAVKVVIDGAVIQRAGVVFEYRPNPHPIELLPNKTIPVRVVINTYYYRLNVLLIISEEASHSILAVNTWIVCINPHYNCFTAITSTHR